MQKCTVCVHESISKIDAALLKGVPAREISRSYDIGRASLSRHRKNHIGLPPVCPATLEKRALEPGESPEPEPATPKAKTTKIDYKSDQPVVEQVKAVCAATWKLIERAQRKGNLGVANQGLRNLTETLRTLATLTGELTPTPTNVFNFTLIDTFVAARRKQPITVDIQKERTDECA